MSEAAAAGGLLAGFAVTLAPLAFLALRARRLGRRLESLARPIHELRGALGAIELCLTAMERTAEKEPTLNPWIDALRLPLERASLGIRDVDVCRNGRGAEGAASPVRRRLDLRAVVSQSVHAWSRVAPSYEARLRVDWRAGPVCAQGDAARLRQALDNLIANALEHGGGRVLVEGELQGGYVRIKVSDGGPGIGRAPGKLAERPWSSARGHGLAIAHDVVRAHGGRLVAGVGGHGPALVIELPAELPAGELVRAGRRRRAQSAGAAPRPGSRAPSAA